MTQLRKLIFNSLTVLSVLLTAATVGGCSGGGITKTSATSSTRDFVVALGVVEGLAGTGDGDYFPLGRALANNGIPADGTLRYALVSISVSVPPDSRVGQFVDAQVCSVGPATSLRGGSLITVEATGALWHADVEIGGPLTSIPTEGDTVARARARIVHIRTAD